MNHMNHMSLRWHASTCHMNHTNHMNHMSLRWHASTGCGNPGDFQSLLLKGVRRLKCYPTTPFELELTPVDAAASRILRFAGLTATHRAALGGMGAAVVGEHLLKTDFLK